MSLDRRAESRAVRERAPGGFRIITKLSEGGMGEVFLGQRIGEPDLLVIKTLLPEMGADPTIVERFLREAEIASRLNHPNIAKLEVADFANGDLFLAFEYVPGVDFYALLSAARKRKAPIPSRIILSLAVQILDALAYAHEIADDDGVYIGLVHRDLAPQNLMVTFDGEAKIIDFGLAHATLGDLRTESGLVLGTLRYTSPEQARGERVDARSDLYTLALVILEALIGEPIVPEKRESEIWSIIEKERAPRLSDRRSDLPEALSKFFERALEKDRDRRFSSAEAMRKALTEAAQDLVGAEEDEIGDHVQAAHPEEYKKTLRLFELFEELADGEATPSNAVMTATLPDAETDRDPPGSDGPPTTRPERLRPREAEASVFVVSSRMIEPLSGTRNERPEPKRLQDTSTAEPQLVRDPVSQVVRDGDARREAGPIAPRPFPRLPRGGGPVLVAALVALGIVACLAIGAGAYYATEYLVAAHAPNIE